MPHLISRLALVAAAATAVTACASTAQYPIVEGGAPGSGPQMARPSPAYPVQTPAPAENMPAPQARPTAEVESATLTAAAPAGAVESSQLPPTKGEGDDEQDADPVTAGPSRAPRVEAEPALRPAFSPPPPQLVTKVVTLAPGKVVDVDGRPATYTVKEGQGLDAVARAMGSSRKELATLNNLKEPFALKPGQTLKGPASRAKAYVVAPGDTLSQVSRRFGVSVQALADENDIETAAPLRVGQKIKLPTGFKDAGPQKKTVTVTPVAPLYMPPVADPVPEPRPEPVRPQPVRPAPRPQPEPEPEPVRPLPQPVRPQPRPEPIRPQPEPVRPEPVRPQPTRPIPTPTPVRPTPTPVPTPSRPSTVTPAPTPRPSAPLLPTDRPPTLSDSEVAELGRGRFQWPVRGEVISSYGPKGAGRRNDGVDIGAPSGTPVRAAAAGKVVYSGGDVPGFGVTVLVQHEDGWVTVYGNLQRAEVRMQQSIPAGFQIGTVGQSGGAAQPQLHFEVRYSPSPRFKAKAIDPALVLPR